MKNIPCKLCFSYICSKILTCIFELTETPSGSEVVLTNRSDLQSQDDCTDFATGGEQIGKYILA